jgi:hypothetical protein
MSSRKMGRPNSQHEMTRETKKLITIISTLNAIILSTAHFLQSCIEDIFGGTHMKLYDPFGSVFWVLFL